MSEVTTSRWSRFFTVLPSGIERRCGTESESHDWLERHQSEGRGVVLDLVQDPRCVLHRHALRRGLGHDHLPQQTGFAGRRDPGHLWVRLENPRNGCADVALFVERGVPRVVPVLLIVLPVAAGDSLDGHQCRVARAATGRTMSNTGTTRGTPRSTNNAT